MARGRGGSGKEKGLAAPERRSETQEQGERTDTEAGLQTRSVSETEEAASHSRCQGGRDQRDAAPGQGCSQGGGCVEGTGRAPTCTWGFWAPELKESQFLLIEATTFVVIC